MIIRSATSYQTRMGIEDAFLHEILTHPDDDAPRLIFADWLDEHNDPRGEIIRIQCALAQLSDEAPALRGLLSLNLSRNISCDDGAAALASSEWTRLQALDLWFNGVGDRAVQALAQSESFFHLTRLDLSANCITSAGARSLIHWRGLSRLARLDLLRNAIGAREQQLLRDRFGAFVYR